MGSTVLFALQVETWDAAEDLQPRGRVATDLDLRLHWSKRVEGLIEQVTHHASLRSVAGRADVVNRQVVINPHVALDEASDLPALAGAVEAFEHQNVAAAGRAAIALAAALLVWVRQAGTDGIPQRRGVIRLGRADTVCQTSLFHAAPCRTA